MKAIKHLIASIILVVLWPTSPTSACYEPVTPRASDDSTYFSQLLADLPLRESLPLPLLLSAHRGLTNPRSKRDLNVTDHGDFNMYQPGTVSTLCDVYSGGSNYGSVMWDVGDAEIRSSSVWSADNKRFPRKIKQLIRLNINSYKQTHKDARADKALLVNQLTAFDSLSHNKPLFFSTIYGKFGGDIKAYVDYLYKRSFLTNRFRLNTFMRWPSAKKIEQDPGVQFIMGLALYELWLKRGGEAAAAETRDSTAVPPQTDSISAK